MKRIAWFFALVALISPYAPVPAQIVSTSATGTVGTRSTNCVNGAGQAVTCIVPGVNILDASNNIVSSLGGSGVSYTLLSNASASGAQTAAIAGGNYALPLAGTFGGTTLTLTQTVDGVSSTVATYTSAPATVPCFAIGNGTKMQMTVSGGAPSGLYASLNNVGTCPVAASSGGGDASAANQTAVQANAGSSASKANAVQGISGGLAVPVSSTTLATVAKQPALGTAGTASADVLSVQGIASMTALKVDPSAVTSPVSAASLPLPTGAATSANQATEITSLGTINTTLGTPLQAGGSIVATGNVADAATDSGNPVKTGGVYNSTLPTYTTGQRTTWQCGTKGSCNVTLWGPNGSTGVGVVTPADALAVAAGLAVTSSSLTYNNSTYDRIRSIINNTNSAGTGIQAVGTVMQCDDTSQTAITENSFGNTRMDCSNHGLITRPYESSANSWFYAAAASGISNTTTAVTVKAAAGSGIKICTTAIQITATSLGAASELALRDGAGGTVVWRSVLSTAGGNQSVTLPSPVCGTANTLLEVVTLTATVTGNVYVNVQGYVSP